MAIISGRSKLARLHPQLVTVVTEVANVWDVAILETERTTQRQQELFRAGKSRTMESKHLIQPSGWAEAVDWAPLPIDWNDLMRFYYFGGFALGVAYKLGIRIRAGIDWNNNTQIKDQSFNDCDHIELGPT